MVEALRSGARLGQPGSKAVLNLFESRAKRDALIDRVVSFGATNQEVTVLKTPVAFDSTVIDTTLRSQGTLAPDTSIATSPTKKRRLKGWGNLAAGVTAIIAGLATVGGSSPAPAQASGNRMLTTASSEGTGENCENADYVRETDLVFARKIISGKITITPEEAWLNLGKPALECPVVVEPTILTPEEGIFNQEYQEVTFDNLTRYAHRLYAPIEEEGLDLPPSRILPETSQFHDRNLKYINKTLEYIENGGELDNTDQERRKTRMMVTYDFSLFAYTVYKESREVAWLTLAQKAWFHGETAFGEEQFDEFAARRINRDGGFTF